ncbi:MAG: family transporter protein [Streptosporangiaceae bacterium]|jgi:ABC-2 type transport system permease protein|nr:family transporter protein [Streptosporangiaceae bacterium]
MTAVMTPAPPVMAGAVTQVRVVHSEWIKLRTLRSTFFTLLFAVIAMVGLGMLFCYVFASQWTTMEPQRKADFSAVTVPLRGYFLAQLAVGVLGVLVISGEYSTGMIRATLSAVPRRLPVLWAKAAVFAAVTLTLMLVSSFAAFFGGQLFLRSQHLQTTLSAPGALRIVTGVALYLTVVGLLGVALGALIRNTAGAIAAVFGLLLVLPVLGEVLPSSWGKHVTPYLPSNAGQALLNVHPDPGGMAPWTGFGLFCLYALVALAGAAVMLRRRDA